MKYFKSDKDWEYNSQLSKVDNKWLFYGEGYRQACELIENQILKIDRSDQDFLIYPYCYLMRHYIEIRLKEIISEGNKLCPASIDTKGGHNLSFLWDKSQETLKNVWQDQYKDAPKEVFDFITELHSIDVKSDNFRYPIDKNGKDTLDNINQINFKKLSEAFRNVKYYLDGITDELSIAKENNYLLFEMLQANVSDCTASELPGNNKTFKQIAKVLESGQTKHYNPTKEPNNH
ncbi:DUF7003 family protein [Sinomicrobium sp. M5D2P9]